MSVNTRQSIQFLRVPLLTTGQFQCLHLQWRIETPLWVEPPPPSSAVEGSVH